MAAKKYNEEFHPQLARWIVSFGYTDRRLAKELNVAESTIQRWKRQHREFAQAVEEGAQDIGRIVENKLLECALGSEGLVTVEIVEGENEKGSYSRTRHARIQPSLAAQKFWLQHRQPDRWRDKPPEDPVVYDEPEFLT